MHRALMPPIGLATTLFLAGITISSTQAQSARTIAVSGTGSASGNPEYLVMRASLNAGGENGAEAMEKFKETKEKLQKAFATENDSNITIEFQGESLNKPTSAAAMEMFGGEADPQEEGEFSISEKVIFKISFQNDMERIETVNDLGELVDRAVEAGARFGGDINIISAAYGLASSSFVKYGIENTDSLRRESFKSAMQVARGKAQMLADLGGGKLGKVISIEELELDDKTADSSQMNPFLGIFMADDGTHENDLQVPENRSVEIKTRLRVVFELLDQ